MLKETLNIISNDMASLNINYSFMEWTSAIVYPYFVGEYQEGTPMNEDGLQETTFILTGFSRGSWLELETAKEIIRNQYRYDGKTAITSAGNGIAISYGNSLVVPTGDAELKKIQINLNIKEWKVN